MTLVRETVVDGVRTMWVDSGRPTLLATLMFRAGRADEVLTTAGWLHLLEHLALHGLHRGSLAVNGSVARDVAWPDYARLAATGTTPRARLPTSKGRRGRASF